MLATQTFLRLVGIIFGVIGTLHLLRFIFGWQIVLVGWEVPVWLSAFGVVIGWFLSYNAFSLAKKIKSKK